MANAFNPARAFTGTIKAGGSGGAAIKPPRVPKPPITTKPKGGGGKGPTMPKGNKGGGKGKTGGGKGKGHGAGANANANPFTAPYTKQEKAYAKGVVQQQVNEPISELAKTVASNRASNQAGQKVDFGYYMQLAAAAQQAVAQSGQIGAGLNTTLAGIGANTQSTLAQLGAQQQQGAVGRFNALGLGGDSAAQLAATTAQQQGLGALQSQAAQNFGAQQGNAYQQAAVGNRGVGALAGTEQIGNLARAGALANEPLNAKIAGLKATKGAVRATALGTLRQNEVNATLTQEGLTGKTQALNESIREFNQRNATTRRGQTLSHLDHLATVSGENTRAAKANATRQSIARSDNSTRKLLAGMKKNASGGSGGSSGASGAPKPATTIQRNAVFAHIDYLTGQIQEIMNAGYSKGFAWQTLERGGSVKMGVRKSPTASNPNRLVPVFKTFYPNRLGTPILNMALNVRPGGSGLSPGDLAYLRSIGIFHEARYPRSNQSKTVGNAVSGAATGRPAGGLF